MLYKLKLSQTNLFFKKNQPGKIKKTFAKCFTFNNKIETAEIWL